MTPLLAAILAIAVTLLAGCDDSVSLSYSTRGEAEADRPFARGWLPEIVPPSSKAIAMTNDLDLNISNGEFQIDPVDHDEFVSRLERTSSKDEDGFSAYAYEDWTFWISPDKSNCRFYMRLSRDKKLSEQGAEPNP